jgi:hypothetical protein
MVIRKKYDLMFQDIMLDLHFSQVGRSRKENIDMSNNDLNMVKAMRGQAKPDRAKPNLKNKDRVTTSPSVVAALWIKVNKCPPTQIELLQSVSRTRSN